MLLQGYPIPMTDRHRLQELEQWRKTQQLSFPRWRLSFFGVIRYLCCGYACMPSHFNHVWLFTTSWTVAQQAPLSMGFSRQEYGRGLPYPPPGDLPDPGIDSMSLPSPALAGGFFTISAIWEACCGYSGSHFELLLSLYIKPACKTAWRTPHLSQCPF